MGWASLAVLVVVAGAVAWLFNTLVGKRQMAENGWSDIDVQLRRRADLIPQLVASVRGYAAHESALFEEIAERRAAALSAGDDVGARGSREARLQGGERRLLALAEDYPELKADSAFLDLQEELSETETKIEMARRFYNGAVRELNTAVESFPSNLVARAFGFSRRDFFEMDDRDAPAPEVGFGA